MRPFVAFLVAAVVAAPAPARAQDRYAAVLLQYLTGDATAALTALSQLDPAETQTGVTAFDTTRSRQILTGAAALHTEAALRGNGNPTYHLQIATAIVEFGERHTAKTNTPRTIHPQFAVPVSEDFRRLWYCAVIASLETRGSLRQADHYLEHALALYPNNAEVRLLAGVDEEMHASPRTSDESAGSRRKALEEAERDFRVVIAAEPDRLEARLRLGHVLQERDKIPEARAMLTPLTTSSDDRVAYLAGLFLGGLEDGQHRAAAAVAMYDAAAARMPAAQTARLAAGELRHRGGDHQAAADAIAAAAGPDNGFDPWWTYSFGEYWRVDLLLDAVRARRRV
jgi:tetratricopeptide (TPR) repeat protein